MILFSILSGLSSSNEGRSINIAEGILDQSYSTNPGSPVALSNDVSVLENFPSTSTSFYYSTYSMSASYYHLITLNTRVCASGNPLIQLYSDSSYSNFLTLSQAVGDVDWIVYRPSSSQAMYPIVTTPSSVAVQADVEAKSASSITKISKLIVGWIDFLAFLSLVAQFCLDVFFLSIFLRQVAGR